MPSETQSSADGARIHDFTRVRPGEEINTGDIEWEITRNRDRPLSVVLKGVIEQVRSLTDAEGALIAILDAWGVVCRASAGEAPEVGSRLQAEPSLTRKCIESGQAVICEDTGEDLRVRLAGVPLRLRSVVVVPVQGQGSVLGIVEVLSSRPAAFSPQHIAALERIARLVVPMLQREQPEPPKPRRGTARTWTAVSGAALLLVLLVLWFGLYHPAGKVSSAVAPSTPNRTEPFWSPPVQPGANSAEAVAVPPEVKGPAVAPAPALVIDGVPPGAQIFVDDQLMASTSSNDKAEVAILSPGRHRLRVSVKGYQDYERDIQLLPGQTSTIEAKLEPFEQPPLPEPGVASSAGSSATIPSISSLSLHKLVAYRTFKAHSGWVTGLAFSPDGQRLASASSDQTVKFWNVSTDQEATTIASKIKEVQALALSRDGHWLAAENSSKVVTLWDAATGRELRTFSNRKPGEGMGNSWVYSIAFSPDSRSLASGVDDKTIRLWEVGTGEAIRDLTAGHRSLIYVAFSPNGRWLASGSDDKTIQIWEVATGKPTLTLRGHKKDVYAAVFSPNGRYLASASADKTVRLWDVATGREIYTLTGHESDVTSLAFSPDSRWLASGSWDQTIKIWDVQSGREVRTLTGYDHHIYTVAFDSRGRWLASGSEDGTIKLWQLGQQ
jgi:WD40 repeat protein